MKECWDSPKVDLMVNILMNDLTNQKVSISSMMLISVVIPVYNVKSYLRKCLNSVINQTYYNMDIIIIDDGSTDGSENICDDYAATDERIRCVHQENMGLSGARNRGIELSRGNFITFIDGDDFIEKDMIEDLVQSVRQGIDIIACGFVYCDKNGEKLSVECCQDVQILSGKKQMEGLFYNRFCTTSACGKLYAKKLFKTVQYPVGKYHEDVFTTYKLFDISQGIIILNRGLYWYRQNPDSIMHQRFRLSHLDGIEASMEREKFVSIYYPNLKGVAKASVVYSCCKCSERMFQAGYQNSVIENGIKEIIRKNLLFFLIWGKNSVKTKLFAVLNAVSPSILRTFYKLYNQKGRKGDILVYGKYAR